jgi:hypothetical protein
MWLASKLASASQVSLTISNSPSSCRFPPSRTNAHLFKEHHARVRQCRQAHADFITSHLLPSIPPLASGLMASCGIGGSKMGRAVNLSSQRLAAYRSWTLSFNSFTTSRRVCQRHASFPLPTLWKKPICAFEQSAPARSFLRHGSPQLGGRT